MTLFVAAKAAVGITVKGNAAVKAAFHHGLFQIFQMGAAHAPVDVLAVRRNADKGALCAQTGNSFCATAAEAPFAQSMQTFRPVRSPWMDSYR